MCNAHLVFIIHPLQTTIYLTLTHVYPVQQVALAVTKIQPTVHHATLLNIYKIINVLIAQKLTVVKTVLLTLQLM